MRGGRGPPDCDLPVGAFLPVGLSLCEEVAGAADDERLICDIEQNKSKLQLKPNGNG